MKYKVLATDMDGTLLKNNKSISNEDLLALRKAKEMGMEIVICTGRPFGMLEPYLKQLGFPCWVVTNNGAVVRNKALEVVQVTNLEKKPTIEALRILEESGIYYHATGLHYSYVQSYWERVKVIQHFIGQKKNVSKFNSWVQALWMVYLSGTHKRVDLSRYVGDGGALSSIFVYSKDIEGLKKLRAPLESVEGVHVTSSGKFNIEILDTNATKGRALKKVLAELGVSKEETITVGDNHNDLSMITFAGLGVAMENSEAEVLEVADWVTKSNEEDGISYLIEVVLMNNTRKSVIK
ncbi:Cof-type HAD-IIB family hydrolase [Alkaliphilus hydrothermalis]|uniref:Cof subfamily protein (Haloacid dehalogenase superfamily) n=1 Tax=Alkaliphilus hydrothermalis TaxID=1482730 RepID=A0ABS2NTH4_9FIRM|nr:Cof-type HAD-IIB family hydrolase [Alkaliphilus hydrothermalis]MBM7616274.1 Cof subfamily protein (haloacid dehalogenase superfamily) [Alkaliphilus hydrothermalis]